MAINNIVPVQLQESTNLSDTKAYINKNFRTLSDALNPIQISNGTNNLVLAGKDSDGVYGFKVAKPGYDAYDAEDANLIFNSNQNVFKIVESGTAVINYTPTSTYNYTTVTHALTYIPIVIAYGHGVDAGTLYPLPISFMNGDSSDTLYTGCYVSFSATSTTITFSMYTINPYVADPFDMTISYYMLQESAN